MPIANIKSKWVNGNLVFADNSGNEIAVFDAANEALDIKKAHLDGAEVTEGIRASVRHTWAGGVATTDTVTVTGVAATDRIFAQINVAGASAPTTVVSAERTDDNEVTITLDQNGEDDVTVVSLLVIKTFA